MHHTAVVFNSYSKFCREPTTHWLLCFCVSSVTKCQNDALTKVVIIGQNQIIKSLVNADCCFGLCLVISIQSTKLTASLNPLLLILSVLQWFFFHAFASFEEAPVANHFDHHSDILNSPFFSSNILLSLKFLVFFVKSNYEISRN